MAFFDIARGDGGDGPFSVIGAILAVAHFIVVVGAVAATASAWSAVGLAPGDGEKETNPGPTELPAMEVEAIAPPTRTLLTTVGKLFAVSPRHALPSELRPSAVCPSAHVNTSMAFVTHFVSVAPLRPRAGTFRAALPLVAAPLPPLLVVLVVGIVTGGPLVGPDGRSSACGARLFAAAAVAHRSDERHGCREPRRAGRGPPHQWH